MTSTTQSFHLGDELLHHGSDVKAVLAIGLNHFASASRDTTVALWRRGDSSGQDKAGAGLEIGAGPSVSQETADETAAALASLNVEDLPEQGKGAPNDIRDKPIVPGEDTGTSGSTNTFTAPSSFYVQASFRGHDSYVNSLAYIPGSGTAGGPGTSTDPAIGVGGTSGTSGEFGHGKSESSTVLGEGSVLAGEGFESGGKLDDKGTGGRHTQTGPVSDLHSSPQGYLASGDNSGLIFLHSLSTLEPEPVDFLIGHALNVCVLKYAPKRGKLVSGSWDRTARVWRRVAAKSEPDGKGGSDSKGGGEGETDRESGLSGWECELVLDRHEQAVWGVEVVESTGQYLTGAADNLVRLWSPSGDLLSVFKGSPEPVRSLTLLPGDDFASASNDGIVRIWDLTGSVIAALKGHEDYIYGVAWCGAAKEEDGVLMSCGEDKTARIWSNRGMLLSTLTHPCQSVWSVTAIRGDVLEIITAGSDGIVRVWREGPGNETTHSVMENDASEDAEELRDNGVCADGHDILATAAESAPSARDSASSRPEGPPPELSSAQPAESGTSRTAPEKVGQGTDGSGSGSADQETEPRLVIDIDIADDKDPIPLVVPFGAEPRQVAREFGAQHGLSDTYVDRIEEFVRAHLG